MLKEAMFLLRIFLLGLFIFFPSASFSTFDPMTEGGFCQNFVKHFHSSSHQQKDLFLRALHHYDLTGVLTKLRALRLALKHGGLKSHSLFLELQDMIPLVEQQVIKYSRMKKFLSTPFSLNTGVTDTSATPQQFSEALQQVQGLPAYFTRRLENTKLRAFEQDEDLDLFRSLVWVEAQLSQFEEVVKKSFKAGLRVALESDNFQKVEELLSLQMIDLHLEPFSEEISWESLAHSEPVKVLFK